MGLFEKLFGRKKVFSTQSSETRMWQSSHDTDFFPACKCLEAQYDHGVFHELAFHSEEQNTTCEGWKKLLELIDAAAVSRATEFSPGLQMPLEHWSQIITLPRTIAKLTSLRKFYLYGSHLVRIPPEIGELANLEELDLYTSYRLHWMPFEITRCSKLTKTRFSTRALYGNYKYRPPFPKLASATKYINGFLKNCSVCRNDFKPGSQIQVWISLKVGNDVLPLLVNACSEKCVKALPSSAENYVDGSHGGGFDLEQPPRIK